MRIRLVRIPLWSYRGEPWPDPGTIIDLPEGIARDMVQSGLAEPAGIETVAAEPTERAAQVGRSHGRRPRRG